MIKTEDATRFYAALAELEQRLGGKRTLKDCHGRLSWPDRGVYFFFEDGQTRSNPVRAPGSSASAPTPYHLDRTLHSGNVSPPTVAANVPGGEVTADPYSDSWLVRR
jgi:hypothetical protein